MTLEIEGKLELGLSRIEQKLEDLKKVLLVNPVYRKIYGNSSNVNSSNIAIINLGGPPPDRFWEVRKLSVGTLNATTNPAVVVAVLDYDPPASLTSVPVDSLEDYTNLTLPIVGFYSAGQFVVNPGEVITVVIGNAQPGSTYCAKATIVDAPIKWVV